MAAVWQDLFAPGLFSSPPVVVALVIGTVVAIASGVVGFFVVLRGQAFLGHALGDMGATGAAGAALAGVQALWGFLAGGLLAGTAVDLLGGREHERDVATGIVLSAMLGLSAFFLYLLTTATSQAGTVQSILFGSVFTVAASIQPAVVAFSALTLALVAALYRPLLFASLSPDAAEARGIPVRAVGLMFVVAVVAAVELSALVLGALVSTALLVGPAATAARMTDRPGSAMALSALWATAAMWLGIILSYDSYLWPPAGRGWPVSFFVTALLLAGYVLTFAGGGRRRRTRQAARGDA